MPRGDRHLLLVNPVAGGGRAKQLLPDAERALTEAGLEYRLVFTEGIEHGRREAVEAAQAGDVPVVMSGDGLIGQVGGALAGSPASLGVIPGGRGNDFARVVGIPDDVGQAVATLADGSPRPVDVGEVNGRRFLCIASCGFDSDANRIANESRIKGRLVYAYAALRALLAWKPARFTLTLDGERTEFRGYAVAAANSRAYGGGMFIAPDAELDDGLLDVVCDGRRRQAPLSLRACRRCSTERTSATPRSRSRAPPRRGSRPIAPSPSTPTVITSPTCRRPFASCRGPCG